MDSSFSSGTDAIVEMVAEWTRLERRCCPFFEFTLRVELEDGPVSLRLTGGPGVKEFIKEESEVVPHVELRRAARAAVANLTQDEKRRGVAAVGARHAGGRAGRIVEIGPVRDVEHVHIRHDPAVAVARQLEPVRGSDARQREVVRARRCSRPCSRR